MQSFLESIEKELNRAIRNLARQDFNSAVDNIEYVSIKIRNILFYEKVFYGFNERLTKKGILQKYPSINFNQIITDIKDEKINLFYFKEEKKITEEEIINKYNDDSVFIVEKGIDIKTGEIIKINIYSLDEDGFIVRDIKI